MLNQGSNHPRSEGVTGREFNGLREANLQHVEQGAPARLVYIGSNDCGDRLRKRRTR